MSESHKVLIVDDDDMIRDVVARMLKIKGHQPDSAENGDAALEKLHEDPNYSYVILDLNMPGKLSGEQTFYKLRELYSNLKIIISTGFIDGSTASKFKSDGVHGILEKPYRIDDLLEMF